MPHRNLAVLAFLAGAFAVFAHSGSLPLIAPDEGRNAEVAREMSLSGAWLVPAYDGAVYLDKPAFYFKTVALSLSAFGESEAAARLPSGVFGFGLLAVIYAFCRRVYGGKTALAALLVVATTPLYMAFSRLVIFDIALAFFVCSSIFACYLAEEESEAEAGRGGRWYLLAAALAGCATLVKGPVGFLLPTLTVGCFNWAEGRGLGAMRRFFRLPNWAVFLGLVLPWFVGLSIACPDFPYYGIMKESVSRFASQEFHRSKPFYFYALIILSCFFPWSLLLPESVPAAWRGRARWGRADRLFVIWACVVVVFFSLSQSKLPGYILTAVTSLGVLAARVFVKAGESTGAAQGIVRRATLALAVLSALAALALAALLLHPEAAQGLRLKPGVFEMFKPALPAMAASFGAVAALAAAARALQSPQAAFAAFLGVPLLLLTAGFEPLSIYAENRSSRLLARQMAPKLSADTEVACLECLPNGLPFYLKRLVTVISKDGSELTSNYVLFRLGGGNPWPERIVPLSQRDAWLAGRGHPVYLLAEPQRLAQLQELAARRGAPVEALASGYHAALLAVPGGR